MTDEKKIEIMLEDNCTMSDAIHHLKKGADILKADEWLEYIVRDYGDTDFYNWLIENDYIEIDEEEAQEIIEGANKLIKEGY